jgi:hypothetical protein
LETPSDAAEKANSRLSSGIGQCDSLLFPVKGSDKINAGIIFNLDAQFFEMIFGRNRAFELALPLVEFGCGGHTSSFFGQADEPLEPVAKKGVAFYRVTDGVANCALECLLFDCLGCLNNFFP